MRMFSAAGRKRFATYFQIGMPPASAPVPEDAGSERDTEVAAADHRHHRGKELRRIWVVWVEHHNDVGATRERRLVTGLLVASDPRLCGWMMQEMPRSLATWTVLSREQSSTKMTSSTTGRSVSE